MNTGQTETRRTGSGWPERHRTAVRISAVSGLLCVVLVGLEMSARRSTAMVVDRKVRHAQTSEELLDPGEIVQSTPEHGKRLIPNVRALVRNHPFAGRDVLMQINSLGYRGPEIVQPKPPARFRILALGDSITMGEGVQEEETFVRRLEADLRSDRPEVEVVNGGVGDTGTKEQVDGFRERGRLLDPDVIVVGFYLNDSRPPWGFAGELGARGWLRRHSRLVDLLYKNLLFWRWIHEQGQERFAWVGLRNTVDWQGDPGAFSMLVSAAKFDWGSAWDPASWSTLYQQFSELKTLAEGRKIVFVVFPVMYQVYSQHYDAAPQIFARNLAARLGFSYLDLLPLLRAHANEAGDRLFYDDCHPTPAGHELIARDLADFMRTLVLAGPP